ncbi:MAG: cob(I)yrinic acid a,c-diamide adenosyltransferase [Deltaproteobacteria bacterium]|nr:cob(I)yrinic acid a,c-diamide adenosyltransferase [Deltaproteobacteria bacterium]
MEGPGLIQVYTGNGKGKTTASLGLALRAAGHGYKTIIIQFMKGKIDYGELKAQKLLEPYLKIVQAGGPHFIKRGSPSEQDIKMAHEGLEEAKRAFTEGSYNIVILDELNVAIDFGLITLTRALELIKQKPPDVELIITGRYARQEIIDIADLVTEMREIKHYYQKGVQARDGIEK